MSKRERTRARETALQALYQADLVGEDCMEGIRETLLRDGHPVEVVDYAFDLARGVRARLADIDSHLASAAQHWSVGRMAIIDRNVLRIGVEELLQHPEVPPRVVINEAIELAKRFSTQQSGAFVNGVLDRIRKDLIASGRMSEEAASNRSAQEPGLAPRSPSAPDDSED